MTRLFQEDSADDLMRASITATLNEGERITPSKGAARDLTGVILELANPVARLSRTAARGRLFSALGELMWYLSGTNDADFIEYYIAYYRERGEKGLIWGGYGPRLFSFDGFNQVQYVIGKLRSNPSSRQAVIQIYDHSDVADSHDDVPCTCVLQYFVRSGGLSAIVYMRSNDAHLGLPHDIFAFTFLQELIAKSLGVPLGPYVHIVGSFHVYEKDVEAAEAFLHEGWQSNTVMPTMPEEDPWPAVESLLELEQSLRLGTTDPTSVDPPWADYWADLGRLLAIFALLKQRRREDVDSVRRRLTTEVYDVYIGDKLDAW